MATIQEKVWKNVKKSNLLEFYVITYWKEEQHA
jgi:hypothetical protein